MIFRICKEGDQIFYRRNVVQLQWASKEDSLCKVSFTATFYDSIGRPQRLGLLRIGMRGMTSGSVADHLPTEFSKLPDHFFSLGQDEYYYENVNKLHTNIRNRLMESLRDIAYDPEILTSIQDEDILNELFRDIAGNRAAVFSKIRGQLHRMTMGSARLTKYSFSYTPKRPDGTPYSVPELRFSVAPESTPPTNIHALIGRNGCGKTHMIRNMVRCLQENGSEYGEIKNLSTEQDRFDRDHPNIFVNALCISFSPFDDFRKTNLGNPQLPLSYIGLNKNSSNLRYSIWKEFWGHFKNCLLTERKKQLWLEAVKTLESDPAFFEEGVHTFINDTDSYPEKAISKMKERQIRSIFDNLSSGHKVVLLIITSCVAEIEERSILFLDEPETHLHPPLLSALIRALSDLLRDRNGMAIIATHSPIVLQEIPRSCVWLLTRTDHECVYSQRLDHETFGASIGTLIDDAFSFEVNESGFHKMMVEAVKQYESYDDIMDLYEGQLGNEAGIFLRLLLRKKQWKGK